MSDRSDNSGAGGSNWEGREVSTWWPANGEMQQQIVDQVARSTASSTSQPFNFRLANEGNSQGNMYECRPNTSGRQSDNAQAHWWYNNTDQEQPEPPSPGDDSNQQESRDQSSPDEPQHQHQTLQQAIQHQQNQALQLHQQTLQHTLQQQQQQHQSMQEAHLQSMQQQSFAELQQSIINQQIQKQNRLNQQQMSTSQTTTTASGGGGGGRSKNENPKPRGLMTAYAFFVQACREAHRIDRPEEKLNFSMFSKQCAEKWNSMNEKDKALYHELAGQDKKRYEYEMSRYIPPVDGKGALKGAARRKKMKDPNAPKRSLSAFIWFCNEERAKVKATFPNLTMGEIAKELGRRWAMCAPTDKARFEAMSDKDKIRYDQEMTAYKKSPLGLQMAEERNQQY